MPCGHPQKLRTCTNTFHAGLTTSLNVIVNQMETLFLFYYYFMKRVVECHRCTQCTSYKKQNNHIVTVHNSTRSQCKKHCYMFVCLYIYNIHRCVFKNDKQQNLLQLWFAEVWMCSKYLNATVGTVTDIPFRSTVIQSGHLSSPSLKPLLPNEVINSPEV